MNQNKIKNKIIAIIFVFINIGSFGFFDLLNVFINSIIAFIIFMCSGLITLTYPKIIYNAIGNISIDSQNGKKSISYIRLGSIIIILCGIFWFPFFYEIVPTVIGKYVYICGEYYIKNKYYIKTGILFHIIFYTFSFGNMLIFLNHLTINLESE